MAKTPKKSITKKVTPKTTTTKKVVKESTERKYNKKPTGTGDGGPRNKQKDS